MFNYIRVLILRIIIVDYSLLYIGWHAFPPQVDKHDYVRCRPPGLPVWDTRGRVPPTNGLALSFPKSLIGNPEGSDAQHVSAYR